MEVRPTSEGSGGSGYLHDPKDWQAPGLALRHFVLPSLKA
jgi:hypothetical protein